MSLSTGCQESPRALAARSPFPRVQHGSGQQRQSQLICCALWRFDLKANKWLMQFNVANDGRLETAETQDTVIGSPASDCSVTWTVAEKGTQGQWGDCRGCASELPSEMPRAKLLVISETGCEHLLVNEQLSAPLARGYCRQVFREEG